MDESIQKCWELGVRPREVCRKCIVFINKVHCWEAPPDKPRPCITNYHFCSERKCPVFEKYENEIFRAMRNGAKSTSV